MENKEAMARLIEFVEETSTQAFLELKEKHRNKDFKFSHPTIANTLKSYGLLDQEENIIPAVKQIIEI